MISIRFILIVTDDVRNEHEDEGTSHQYVDSPHPVSVKDGAILDQMSNEGEEGSKAGTKLGSNNDVFNVIHGKDSKCMNEQLLACSGHSLTVPIGRRLCVVARTTL